MINKTTETFEKFFLAWVYNNHSADFFDDHFYNTFVTPWNRPAHAQDYRELQTELVQLAELFGFKSADEAFQSLERRDSDHADTRPDGEPTEPNESRFPPIAAMPEPSATSTLTRFAGQISAPPPEPDLTAEYSDLEDALEAIADYREMSFGAESPEVQAAVIDAAAAIQRIRKAQWQFVLDSGVGQNLTKPTRTQ